MREFALAVLIVVASYMPLAAHEMPTMPPSDYPTEGTFCGVMQRCTPKATGKKYAVPRGA